MDLSTFFQVLADNLIVPKNPVEGINVLKAPPTRNRSYTEAQQEAILEAIGQHQPHLRLYIMLVSICAVRPIEANRLLVADVDTKGLRLYFRAKNQKVKTKIIPQLLMEMLPDLSGMDPGAFLFGNSGLGQRWEATETSRREHYTGLFREVKRSLKLGKEYGIYSWRHTYITKMYHALRQEGNAPFEAKTRLMLITGHSSMRALEAYLREIDAELPEDYSRLLR